jgi:Putative Ig domain/Subtilase family
MASPHTTGSAAVYLGLNPSATPAQVRDALVNNASTGKVTSPGTGSPNRLLYTGFMNGGTNPNNPSVTNPGNQSTAVGQAVSVQMRASGGTTPYTWSASGLPAGLSISSSTGLITGSPTTAGTSNVTVTVTDAASKTGTASFTWTVTTGGGGCTAVQVVANSSMENGTTPWSANSGVIGAWSSYGYPGHTGTRSAWLGGQGQTHTDYVSQSVTIPAACTSAVLRYWVRISTAENDGQVWDRLTVTMGSTTVASATNLDANTAYAQKTVDVSQFRGQTVTLRFNGVEDQSLQTSFVIDDVTVNAS